MNRVLVWDLPLRLFHWLLVLLVAASFVSAEIGGKAMQLHFLSGYTILALVLFRILWGFAGGTHARFASFVRGPAEVISYLRNLPRRDAPRHLGHNPAGAWSVLLMLLSLLLQAGTGLFANDDESTEGPLAGLAGKAWSDRITEIHEFNSGLLYVLIGLHLAAIVYYLAYRRDNLVRSMLTGFKDAAGTADAPPKPGPAWLAAILLAACAAAVYFVLQLPGKR
jgi:cytochrome b